MDERPYATLENCSRSTLHGAQETFAAFTVTMRFCLQKKIAAETPLKNMGNENDEDKYDCDR